MKKAETQEEGSDVWFWDGHYLRRALTAWF
jgi:hypothetical protein